MPENESIMKKPVEGAGFLPSLHFFEQVCLEAGAALWANARKQPAAESKRNAAVMMVFLLIILFFGAVKCWSFIS